MAGKKRSSSQIIEDKAIKVIDNILPEEWVIRTQTPDYGIDLQIELFDYPTPESTTCETLGEFIYVQVKGTTNIKTSTVKIYPVQNVTKNEWKEEKHEYVEIQVVKYSLETSLLELVNKVGASVCVLLFLVDVNSKRLFFVCLNDLLDKYILPKYPNYKDQKTITIQIPIENEIDGTYESQVPLRHYFKRSKLYAAFSKIHYQFREINRVLEEQRITIYHQDSISLNKNNFKQEEFISISLLFLKQLLNLDIWSIGKHIHALSLVEKDVKLYINLLISGKLNSYDAIMKEHGIVWFRLQNLNNIYEEICREWFLPKFIGLLGSYEHQPEIKKTNPD